LPLQQSGVYIVQQYLARRLLVGVLLILAVSAAVFASMQFIPADAVDIMLGMGRTPEAAMALRHRLGLDQPPIQRYIGWLAGLLRGDLGQSLITEEPVAAMIRQRLPVTIELAVLATLIAVVIGVPAGIIAAVRQYSIADQVSTALSLVGLALPNFWLGTLLILVFSITWRLLPPGGVLPRVSEDLSANLKRMLMPALSMGLPSAAVYFRMTRSSMLEVIRSDYMMTAYSKGVTERRAVVIHALKNALIPVVTVGGLQITWMLGGSFIIESIFSLPGLGIATVGAIFKRDYTVLQGCVLVYSLAVVVVSIGVDLAYAWLDPRIRYE
jgi:peptide/nickel transport system permease protein